MKLLVETREDNLLESVARYEEPYGVFLHGSLGPLSIRCLYLILAIQSFPTMKDVRDLFDTAGSIH